MRQKSKGINEAAGNRLQSTCALRCDGTGGANCEVAPCIPFVQRAAFRGHRNVTGRRMWLPCCAKKCEVCEMEDNREMRVAEVLVVAVLQNALGLRRGGCGRCKMGGNWNVSVIVYAFSGGCMHNTNTNTNNKTQKHAAQFRAVHASSIPFRARCGER
jgi:hypothetical protein